MGEERFYLGRKDKTTCVFVVKQRLHADSVTGKKELFFLFLPHGKGVYSVEFVEARLAPGDVCPEQYLRVAGGGERNARRFKLRADFGGVVVIGGDGSFKGAQKLAEHGINTIGLPGKIDLDIASTEYTIGFDTAVNTAMEAIDKVRDTSTSHERCSIIEVMGRGAGYIALWCGIANGAEDILLPEKYNYDEQMIVNHIIENRKRGKKHHIIINAEGIGHSTSMAKRIEAATGVETRATILGHMQRGGSPTCKDRVYASTMGAKAVDLLLEGKTNRVVGYRHGEFVDFDIDEALAMQKGIPEYQWEICRNLSK